MKNFILCYQFETSRQEFASSLGLLVLRVSVGLMMAFSHGLGKLKLYFNTDTIKFPDPLGVGADLSLLMAGGTELVMSLLIVIGLATRIACIPLIFTMLVAVFIIHGDDPFNKMEFGLLYLFPYIALFLMGPGELSLDYVLTKKS